MAFLWTLWESYQEAGLLMAVNHLWDSLATPRARRACAMAAALGVTGEGRQALLQVLSRFLDQANHDIAMEELPPREAYPDFESWNMAAIAVFDRFHADWEAIARRYEALLDGRSLPTPRSVDRPIGSASSVSLPVHASIAHKFCLGPEGRQEPGQTMPRRRRHPHHPAGPARRPILQLDRAHHECPLRSGDAGAAGHGSADVVEDASPATPLMAPATASDISGSSDARRSATAVAGPALPGADFPRRRLPGSGA